MKQLLTRSSLVLLGSVALAAGCSTSATQHPADGGGAAGAGGAAVVGIPLLPDTGGWVDHTVNTVMIQGAWYGYSDGAGADGTPASGDCEKLGGHPASACSAITAPPFGLFQPTDLATGRMCTTGTAALVVNGSAGSADYSNMWGAGIALDLNAAGGDAGTKSPYNAKTNGVTGFAFDFVDKTGKALAPPLTGIRVEFPTPATGTSAAFWVTAPTDQVSPVKKGHNELRWTQVGGPFYVPQPAPAFDPMNINSIQFHVFTNTSSSIPYDFCIANLSALTN
jgi:hypothetical protein